LKGCFQILSLGFLASDGLGYSLIYRCNLHTIFFLYSKRAWLGKFCELEMFLQILQNNIFKNWGEQKYIFGGWEILHF